MTTALTVPMADIERMAQAVAKSNLFGVKTADQAMTLMLISQAEGRHPALAARDYDIIQGRPAKKSEAMLRDFLQSGGSVQWEQLDDTAAIAVFSHPTGGTVKIDWTMKRAIAAGLGGRDMWKKYPRQMLRSRVVSEGIRTVCPMATSGMYVPEEVADIVRKEVILPNTGAGDDLLPAASEKVDALYLKVMDWIAQDSIGDAYAEIDNAALEVDEKNYLWSRLDSATRAALKDEGEAVRAKAKGLAAPEKTITEAQRKRLEARIGELKLNRDVVKMRVNSDYGIEKFMDLTRTQYEAVYANLDAMVAAPAPDTFLSELNEAEGKI